MKVKITKFKGYNPYYDNIIVGSIHEAYNVKYRVDTKTPASCQVKGSDEKVDITLLPWEFEIIEN